MPKTQIIKKSDFILAKEIVTGLKLHAHIFPDYENLVNFRKYLRDHAGKTAKEFITKTIDGKLRVTRIK